MLVLVFATGLACVYYYYMVKYRLLSLTFLLVPFHVFGTVLEYIKEKHN